MSQALVEMMPAPLPDEVERVRRQLQDMLAGVDERWQREREPIIRQLVAIETLRPAPRFVMVLL